MKFHDLRILTDENVSPKVVTFLRKHVAGVLDVKEQGWQGKSDDELLEIAHRESCWIVTHDADFGTLAIHAGRPFYGIIFLRIRNLQPNNVINVWNQLLHHNLDFSPSMLIVVEEGRVRIRRT